MEAKERTPTVGSTRHNDPRKKQQAGESGLCMKLAIWVSGPCPHHFLSQEFASRPVGLALGGSMVLHSAGIGPDKKDKCRS